MAAALAVLVSGACTTAPPRAAPPAPAAGGLAADAAPGASDAAPAVADAGPEVVPAPAPRVSLRSVTDAAVDAEAASDGALGVVVVDLQTGERVEHHGSRAVPPASLYKLFVAATALHLVDLGVVTLDEPVGAGTCPTVATALDYMITVSDNDCARALATHLGWNVVESWVRQHGYDGTTFDVVAADGGYTVGTLRTSAGDVADLLVDLAEGRLLSPASTEHLVGLLEAQHFASPLSDALGPDLTFGHKLGTLDDVSHDAGIVRVGQRRWVVVAVTSGWPSGAGLRAEPLLSAVGAAARGYVEAQTG